MEGNDTLAEVLLAEEVDNDESIATLAEIYYVYMLMCIVIGLTGNSMVWVLIRSNRILRKIPSNIYLLTLAVMSSVFLISLFTFWLEEVPFIFIFAV
ncbi:unnamed protein product [Gongylonema pulchrum]|uniref:G_PROTEIN_RECEP_F1_2 domain-containing protein n=1 Tax=Gongylonema pulchrum TaxID=637853 RepID=A0A183CZ89_9BILA|nr:unnamed protein product [Gongylonema pulchrum]